MAGRGWLWVSLCLLAVLAARPSSGAGDVATEGTTPTWRFNVRINYAFDAATAAINEAIAAAGDAALTWPGFGDGQHDRSACAQVAWAKIDQAGMSCKAPLKKGEMALHPIMHPPPGEKRKRQEAQRASKDPIGTGQLEIDARPGRTHKNCHCANGFVWAMLADPAAKAACGGLPEAVWMAASERVGRNCQDVDDALPDEL